METYELLTLLTAAGLTCAAGARAFLCVFLVGVFHYSDYFSLSPRFEWIADPVVLSILATLTLLEWIVDTIPELAEVVDWGGYPVKFVAGFLTFAASTGDLDDHLAALLASGLLGGAVASCVHWVRSTVMDPVRDVAEDLHSGCLKFLGLGESGLVFVVVVLSIFFPLAVLGISAIVALLARRWMKKKTICSLCGSEIPAGAAVCASCGRNTKTSEPKGA